MKISKSKALFLSAAMLLIVLFPVKENWTKNPTDSFPLSYYPMFAKERAENYGLYYVKGTDTLGQAVKISYRLAGTGGFNQVRRQINGARKIENGIPFLEMVSEKIARKKPELYGRLSKIQLIKGYYPLEEYFLNNDTLPVLERTLATHKIN